jgi:hypothetical protein
VTVVFIADRSLLEVSGRLLDEVAEQWQGCMSGLVPLNGTCPRPLDELALIGGVSHKQKSEESAWCCRFVRSSPCLIQRSIIRRGCQRITSGLQDACPLAIVAAQVDRQNSLNTREHVQPTLGLQKE